jgi:hypothetical protein
MTAAQRKIERAYQRAMNIRDSTPSGSCHKTTEQNENWYGKMYRRCFKRGDDRAAHAFGRMTRAYLKRLRGLANQ